MARAIWKGSEEDLHFHMVHEKDSSPIGYQKVCKKEKKPVADDRPCVRAR
jgi:non-homologous end joining protein Ku